MFKDEAYTALYRTLKRIFSLPITKSTFRELQKALLTYTEGDTDRANLLLNSLIFNDLQGDLQKDKEADRLRSLVDEFSVGTGVAKDIFERGELLALITSDVINQNNRLLFLNRLRRIDGEEYQFVTDVENTIQIIAHFTGRIQEIEKQDTSKRFIEHFRNQLITIRSKIDQMIGAPTS